MKTISVVLIICLNLCLSHANAQISKEISILPLLNDAEYYYKRLQRNYYTISKFEIDLVSKSKSRFAPVKLKAYQEYTIVIFGERNRIIDLDFKLHAKSNNDWIVVKNINNSTNVLETTFTPKLNDFYEFEIIVDEFSSGYSIGRYCLIVAFD